MICKRLKNCIKEQLEERQTGSCDNNKACCIEVSDKRSAVKCEERGKKYIYENTKKRHVVSFKMDGGIIVEDKTVPPNTNKCDYMLVVNDEEETVILTELKGVDVSKSLEQLKGTLKLYQHVFGNFEHVYARVIVTSSTPNLKATPAYTNLERMLRQAYKGNVKIWEKQHSEKDVDLDKK